MLNIDILGQLLRLIQQQFTNLFFLPQGPEAMFKIGLNLVSRLETKSALWKQKKKKSKSYLWQEITASAKNYSACTCSTVTWKTTYMSWRFGIMGWFYLDKKITEGSLSSNTPTCLWEQWAKWHLIIFLAISKHYEMKLNSDTVLAFTKKSKNSIRLMMTLIYSMFWLSSKIIL